MKNVDLGWPWCSILHQELYRLQRIVSSNSWVFLFFKDSFGYSAPDFIFVWRNYGKNLISKKLKFRGLRIIAPAATTRLYTGVGCLVGCSSSSWRTRGWRGRRWVELTAVTVRRMRSTLSLWPPRYKLTASWTSSTSSTHIPSYRSAQPPTLSGAGNESARPPSRPNRSLFFLFFSLTES